MDATYGLTAILRDARKRALLRMRPRLKCSGCGKSIGHWRERLSCPSVRPSFVLQLKKHRQRQTVDHFRFVERDKFRLVLDRVEQGAEHHLKREANAPRLRRGPAAAHPRQQ